MHTCQAACVEIRGYPVEVGALLPSCDHTQVIRPLHDKPSLQLCKTFFERIINVDMFSVLSKNGM